MKAEYCGYCYFNNVAIAVDKMLEKNLANRVLIVDWDVHHGQATQQMFYDDPRCVEIEEEQKKKDSILHRDNSIAIISFLLLFRVVYFSIHRYEHGEFWPNLKESDYNYVGNGKGEGYNFNVPLNKTGMTDADYLAIFQQVLLPMAYEVNPLLLFRKISTS